MATASSASTPRAQASAPVHHGGKAGTMENDLRGRNNNVDLLTAARSVLPRSSSPGATMAAYRAYRDQIRRTVLSTYDILGFLSSGTYGRVYKASLKRHISTKASSTGRNGSASNQSDADDEASGRVFAIKKFKPDKEDHATYTGISQSAMREIALNRELHHENIITLREVILEDKAIYMVFSYASHDLLQLIHHHSTVLRTGIALPVLKSLLFQLLNGVHYLHSHYVLHRDLKPANILLTNAGVVKIADLGLARIVQAPLMSLYSGDKVVVTIWYRAPELLLGARHYNSKIDMWAIGCIWGELLALRPMFKGEEAKMDPKTKSTPFQSDQLSRIIEVMGAPGKDRWPNIEHMPEYKYLWSMLRNDGSNNYPNTLSAWYEHRTQSSSGFDLFNALLQYDPNRRMSAKDALMHPWFQETEPLPTRNAFASLPNGSTIYPSRRLTRDESDPKMATTQLAPSAQQQQQHAAAVAHALYGAGTNTGAGASGQGHNALAPGGVNSHGNSVGGGSLSHLGGIGGGSGPNTGINQAAPLSGALLSAHGSAAAFPGAGPPAPPPAPASAGSVGGAPSAANSVGPSHSGTGPSLTAAAIVGGGGGSISLGDGPNSVAAAAMANAAVQSRQNKKPRNR